MVKEAVDNYDDWRQAHVRRCDTTDKEIELSYTTCGDPSNPTVLLVMGLNTQGIVWDPTFCELIAAEGFHVIRFDNRDVGKSTKFDGAKCDPLWKLGLPRWFWNKPPYTLRDMAADAVALLTFLNIPSAHWVGVSMGGMISQVAALEFPSHVLSLTSIMSTTGNPSLPDPPLWVAPHFLKAPKSDSKEDIIDFKLAFTKKILLHRCRKDLTYLRQRAEVSVGRSQYARGLKRQLMAIKSAECRDARLSKLTIPTVVIHGDRDILVPTAHGRHTGSVIPNAKTVIVDEMGHYLEPMQFEQMVKEIVLVADRAKQEGTSSKM